MTNTPVTGEVSKNQNQKENGGFWAKILESASLYIDALLVVISIWSALVIFFEMKQHIPELGWPYFLDELMFLSIIFLLCFITVIALKPIIVLAFFMAILFFLFKTITQTGRPDTSNQIIDLHLNEMDEITLRLKTKDITPVFQEKLDSVYLKQQDLLLAHRKLQMQFDSLQRARNSKN